MTIKQLIDELERVEDKDIPVNVFLVGYWDRKYDISHTVATISREVTIVCKNSRVENAGD